MRKFHSHGSGEFKLNQFKTIGKNVIIESEVLVFHPENIEIGDNVYIGHRTILKGYYQNQIKIGNNVWIGQDCFLHGGGGIIIEDDVGIGPYVKLLTLIHTGLPRNKPIIDTNQKYLPVTIGSGSDIGIGSVILPNVTIGKYTQIGAGSIVTKNIPEFSVAAGNPATVIRKR